MEARFKDYDTQKALDNFRLLEGKKARQKEKRILLAIKIMCTVLTLIFLFCFIAYDTMFLFLAMGTWCATLTDRL